jgi:hypothetical protein
VLKSTHAANRVRKHGLATAWGSIKQDAAGRLYAGVEVDLGMHKRHRHELEHLLYAWVYAAQIREARRWRCVLLRCIACSDATAFASLLAAR